MKNLKEQNAIVLALALVGLCALLYGGWTIYRQHVAAQQAHEFFGTPPTGPIGDLYKPSKQPPPQ
jgi:hypothetical protein